MKPKNWSTEEHDKTMQRKMWIGVDNVYVNGVNEMLYSQLVGKSLSHRPWQIKKRLL
jgi:hypothetical protein